MNGYKPFNKVCKYLVLAFVASSGGKFNYDRWDGGHQYPLLGGVSDGHERTWFQGYSAKEYYLLKSIKLIDNTKSNLGIRYYISYNKGDRAPYLISFLLKNQKNGKNIYISYHSFDKKIFGPLVGHGGTPIRYRSGKGADAAKELQKLI